MKKVLGIVMGLGMLLGSFVGLSQSKTDDQRMDQHFALIERCNQTRFAAPQVFDPHGSVGKDHRSRLGRSASCRNLEIGLTTPKPGQAARALPFNQRS